MIPQLYVLAGTALVSFALGGAGAWKVQNWRFDAQEKDRIEQEAKQAVRRADKANTASGTFENKRGTNDVRYRTVTKEVEVYVDRPVYLQQCIDDDGLRALNNQIRRDTNPGQPGLTLPKPAGAGRQDGQGLVAVGDVSREAAPGLSRQGAGLAGRLAAP